MKVADSYSSLLGGVSQQVPQDRVVGQHTEQVNMVPDPVNGLTRRHGSVWLSDKLLGSVLPGTPFQPFIDDTANYKSLDWDTGGQEYVVLYRSKSRPAGSNLPCFVIFNKTTKSFVPVVGAGSDPVSQFLESNGVSAITPVGKYLFAFANGVPVSGNSTDVWAGTDNLNKAVVWVRGGAYSRTYSVTATKFDNSRVTFTHTTPPSSYQGVLSTSDIPSTATEYTKLVNDRVNAYNSAVTQWIGTSTAAIQPSAIAGGLQAAAATAGLAATLLGSHIHFTGVKSLEVSDGGNGELIRGVADEVAAVDQVSAIHAVGKVVKVRSRNSEEAYYLKAVAKDKSVSSGYTEVTWVEAAGTEHTISSGMFYGIIHNGTFYGASSATILTTLVSGTHPTFSPSTSGDSVSSPRPFFVGRQVTYAATFQNRLLLGCGGVLAVSKVDDYLNFFRSTVLTLPASDPFEMLPQGSEDDTLRYSVMYDQDLVVFGDKRQYVINGGAQLSPTSANMAVMASYENASKAAPVAAGGLIFYSKSAGGYSSVYQIQPGQSENSPESFPASSQIDRYIAGDVTDLSVYTGSPSTLYVRSNGKRDGLYAFSYLDQQDGRKMGAWYTITFDAALGYTLGTSVQSEGITVFTLRVSDDKAYIVADFCSSSTGLSSAPYLDSQRPLATVQTGLTSITMSTAGNYASAYASTRRQFTGASLADTTDLLARYPGETGVIVGAECPAFVELTNPYFRDKNGKAILSGRLTITKKIVAYRDSIGLDWDLYYRDSLVAANSFNGRVLGDPDNIIGREPVTSGQFSIPVGKETRQYRLILKARKWYPFTVTAVEWVGQFFSRTYRG